MAGYHKREIKKGQYGQASKIIEEYEEFRDSLEQNNPLMALMELSDMLGAIEAYIKQYNLSLDDLMAMTRITQSVFKEGHRK